MAADTFRDLVALTVDLLTLAGHGCHMTNPSTNLKILRLSVVEFWHVICNIKYDLYYAGQRSR